MTKKPAEKLIFLYFVERIWDFGQKPMTTDKTSSNSLRCSQWNIVNFNFIFKLVLTGGFSLKFEKKLVSTCVQDSSKYSS